MPIFLQNILIRLKSSVIKRGWPIITLQNAHILSFFVEDKSWPVGEMGGTAQKKEPSDS